MVRRGFSPSLRRITRHKSLYMYALRILRSQGLSESSLHEVTRKITLARLLYASPDCWGASPVFLTGHELNAFCNEQFEWDIFRLLCRMPLSWSQRPRLNC